MPETYFSWYVLLELAFFSCYFSGPIKIRKSRLSMLKTGMQRLSAFYFCLKMARILKHRQPIKTLYQLSSFFDAKGRISLNFEIFASAEDLEKSAPRPRSPHMDNEEPIEMAHYPAGHAPEPGIVPPIERADFPAPPYPYALDGLFFLVE